jgi:hypothetical protein
MALSTRRLVLGGGSCILALLGARGPAGAQNKGSQKFPDIVSASVQPRGANVFDFDVTVSSPYDTAQRYADAFRVMDTGGKVFGERVLLHDHAGEQPFTRDLHGVTIPAGIKTIVVQGRDQQHGYGGKQIEIALPGR